jgi:hypothetical protein
VETGYLAKHSAARPVKQLGSAAWYAADWSGGSEGMHPKRSNSRTMAASAGEGSPNCSRLQAMCSGVCRRVRAMYSAGALTSPHLRHPI